MPDEIKNDEGVDFSHYYDSSNAEIQKHITMARNTATIQEQTKQHNKIVVFVSIFVVLALLEIGLLWYSTAGGKATLKSNVPAGYVPKVSPNGMPYFQKK